MEKKIDQLIYFENNSDLSDRINRPLSVVHSFIKDIKSNVNPDKKHLYKKGLVLCHGHNHSNRIISKIDINYWYYVDCDYRVCPDYVADISDENHMKYFPDNYFDCILSVHCPANVIVNGEPVSQYPLILKNVHRILKSDGKLILTELPTLFYWFIPQNHLDIIIKKIHRTIPNKDFESFKKWVIIRDPECTDKDVYFDIMVGNYEGKNYENLRRMLAKNSIKITKNFLLENAYKFEEISDIFLTAIKL